MVSWLGCNSGSLIQNPGLHSLSREIYYDFSLPHSCKVIVYCEPFETLQINPLKAELNPICHPLALLEAHHILHVSRIRVKYIFTLM